MLPTLEQLRHYLDNIGIAFFLGSGSSWTNSELILRLILDCILPRRNCLQRWYLLFLESPMLIFDLTILGRTQIWSQNESRIWYWKPSSTQLNSIGKPRPNKGETQFYTKETQILQRKPRYSFVIVYRFWYCLLQYQILVWFWDQIWSTELVPKSDENLVLE